ncbi:hypothetical protein D9754_18065 [Planomicrobium sp. Y74]|nr:hypothetical protein D9754_18065 [Planomicrobium sp. Y74]
MQAQIVCDEASAAMQEHGFQESEAVLRNIGLHFFLLKKLKPLKNYRGFSFSLSRLQRPSSSGHKPDQLCGKERRAADPAYAFQS